MANKPKVSTITVKVGNVDPIPPGPLNKEVVVVVTLASGSIPLTENNELVLFVHPDGDDKKILRYPSAGNALTWCHLPTGSDFYFGSDEKFLPPNASGEFPYSFIKMTFTTDPVTAGNPPTVEYEGGPTGFIIEKK